MLYLEYPIVDTEGRSVWPSSESGKRGRTETCQIMQGLKEICRYVKKNRKII